VNWRRLIPSPAERRVMLRDGAIAFFVVAVALGGFFWFVGWSG
jgi:hypothetical protein